MKLLIAILLISGCAITQQEQAWLDGFKSVNVGDSFNEMVEKIGERPYSINCYESYKYKSCIAVYQYGAGSFTYNDKNIITSIYR